MELLRLPEEDAALLTSQVLVGADATYRQNEGEGNSVEKTCKVPKLFLLALVARDGMGRQPACAGCLESWLESNPGDSWSHSADLGR